MYGSISKLLRAFNKVAPDCGEDEALEAFNLLVRDELPKRFWFALGGWYSCTFQYWEYVLIGTAAGFTAEIDYLGAFAEGKPLRPVLMDLLRGVFQLLGYWPLLLIMMEVAARQRPHMRLCPSIAWVVTSICVMAPPFAALNIVMKKIGLKAVTSNAWFGVLIVFVVFFSLLGGDAAKEFRFVRGIGRCLYGLCCCCFQSSARGAVLMSKPSMRTALQADLEAVWAAEASMGCDVDMVLGTVTDVTISTELPKKLSSIPEGSQGHSAE